MNSTRVNVVSISGGKDSQATALLAIERETPNLRFVFADTGHEHPITYDHVDYLDSEFKRVAGVGITRVTADFSEQIYAKRMFIARDVRHGRRHGRRIRWSNKAKRQALSVMYPTGNPFLDLCLWKGRFPSSQRRFCTQELKRRPIDRLIMDLLGEYSEAYSWQGIRWGESLARRTAIETEDMGGFGLWAYRPILSWTVDDVFAMHRRHNIAWNPLYEQGMGRVGCMPCIMASKAELKQIATRFPEEFERVREWERLVGDARKRGVSTFFAADKTPGAGDTRSNIVAIADWARTTRGGRQYDLLGSFEAAGTCSSIYGLCE